jgi:murein DD-endopeptidase MepM/ murein hydrolase activator NlpD
VAAQQARRKGWSTDRIAHRIYAPFPVMGPASWSDSWGAPRWAGGYHPHAGQDVMCVYGAPILAVQQGVVTFGHNGLGGDVAYLTRPDGSFWYYAHLSSQAMSLDGTTVEQGDIIGHCGTSGDATVPHLHFGFEAADGTMLDPLRPLLVMLHEAQSSLDDAADHEDARVPTPDPSTALPNLAPWPRHPIPTEQAAVAMARPDIPVAAGVLIAVGVLGPLGFLYRRSRQVEPRGTSRSVS